MNIRRTRLTTGLVLLTYLSTHLLNHALGLISLDAMNDGRVWFLALWRNPAGTALLYTSLLTHFSLALWSLYQRRHLRIPLWEALQLTLGLSIPPLLSLHFVGTRMQHEWFGVDDSYSSVGSDTLACPAVGWTEASDSHHRRLAARLHRLSFLVAAATVVSPGGADFSRLRLTAAGLGAARIHASRS